MGDWTSKVPKSWPTYLLLFCVYRPLFSYFGGPGDWMRCRIWVSWNRLEVGTVTGTSASSSTCPLEACPEKSPTTPRSVQVCRCPKCVFVLCTTQNQNEDSHGKPPNVCMFWGFGPFVFVLGQRLFNQHQVGKVQRLQKALFCTYAAAFVTRVRWLEN